MNIYSISIRRIYTLPLPFNSKLFFTQECVAINYKLAYFVLFLSDVSLPGGFAKLG